MRYFGSKVTANEVIYEIVKTHAGSGLVCDPFGGIGSVGTYLRSKGYNVWSGDLLTFAHYFQISKIKFPNEANFTTLFTKIGVNSLEGINSILNSVEPRNGWFVEEYSDRRGFFTRTNAMKIEACRELISGWTREGLLNADEKAMLLAGLISGMDNVANTAGTYYAYLKSWHRKALNPFRFNLVVPSARGGHGQCFHESADLLTSRTRYNVLYLDPPYNERSYSRYYHLPETIAKCECPEVKGMSGIPVTGHVVSGYNSRASACESLYKMLSKAKFNTLLFHYTDYGLIKPKILIDILSEHGKMSTFTFDAKGYTTRTAATRTPHKIYVVQNV